MSYEIDLTKEDTTSLLELTNYTNPSTIGELLTYDKIDIQDFVKNIVESSYKPNNIVVKDLTDNSFHTFGTAEEVAGHYNATAVAVNEAISAIGPVVSVTPSAAIFNSWITGTYNHSTEVTTSAGPLTYEPVLKQVIFPVTSVATTSTHFATSPTPTALSETIIEFAAKVASVYYGGFGAGLSKLDGKPGFSITCHRSISDLAIIQLTLNGNSLGTFGMPQWLLDKIATKGIVTFAIRKYADRLDFLADGTLARTFSASPASVGPRYNELEAWLASGTLYKTFALTGGSYNTSQVAIYATSKTLDTSVLGWASDVILNSDTGITARLATQENFDLLGITATPAFSHGTALGLNGQSSVTLVNRSYPIDTVNVKFNRISTHDIVAQHLLVTSLVWHWYDSSEWLQSRDIPLAIQMFKDALVASGVNPDKALRNLNATRQYNADGHWYLHFTFDSYVLKDQEFAVFRMPGNFSDAVTVTELNGFVYSPIQSGTVIN